ncbi:unnamed protein product [Cyprideis torosa]|uniref:Uncharacterized protein n=1 Tax=Cyprideis torosa TaxID=163714 RepID=A0A7R8ZS83_9CRUS|nr:unnamed protein product [Cyprideis torosa]CAG0900974.1 unnamed protein product [Cyprideis torosa]
MRIGGGNSGALHGKMSAFGGPRLQEDEWRKAGIRKILRFLNETGKLEEKVQHVVGRRIEGRTDGTTLLWCGGYCDKVYCAALSARVDPYGRFRSPVDDAELQAQRIYFDGPIQNGDDVARHRQSPFYSHRNAKAATTLLGSLRFMHSGSAKTVRFKAATTLLDSLRFTHSGSATTYRFKAATTLLGSLRFTKLGVSGTQ